MNLNGGYAMIKHNSTQEELAVAYKSKRPALFYDENQRAHWAVIEETATESVDEETQEPITLYEYSYRLIDKASEVVANPTLSGNEATLNGLEVDGTKYKVGGGSGGKLYQHVCQIANESGVEIYCLELITRDNTPLTLSNLVTILTNRYTEDQKVNFSVTATKDNIYVIRAFIFSNSIRIRRSYLSDISQVSNFDITVLRNDIISEI